MYKGTTQIRISENNMLWRIFEHENEKVRKPDKI